MSHQLILRSMVFSVNNWAEGTWFRNDEISWFQCFFTWQDHSIPEQSFLRDRMAWGELSLGYYARRNTWSLWELFSGDQPQQQRSWRAEQSPPIRVVANMKGIWYSRRFNSSQSWHHFFFCWVLILTDWFFRWKNILSFQTYGPLGWPWDSFSTCRPCGFSTPLS